MLKYGKTLFILLFNPPHLLPPAIIIYFSIRISESASLVPKKTWLAVYLSDYLFATLPHSPGFPDLSIPGISDQINLCCRKLSVHCRMFSSIPASIHWRPAATPHFPPPVVTMKNVSRHPQMSKNH